MRKARDIYKVGGCLMPYRLCALTSAQLKRSSVRIMLARDLARWLMWRMGAYSPRRPKAAGMRTVASGPHGPPPAPMPRSRASHGSDARHQSPDVILGFAEYALSFPIYLPVFLSHFTL